MCGFVAAARETLCPHDGTRLKVTAAQHLVGSVLSQKYKVLSLLGSGGMGSVYKAEQMMVKKLVAIKVLHGSLKDNSDRIKRFQQEAKLIFKLDHPNIVRALDFGVAQPEEQAFLVMDYVDGGSLWDEIVQVQRLPVERAVNIFVQVADALGYAHSKGILHRDIKPSNIMITKNDDGDDLVKLLDFGVAKLMHDEDEDAPKLTKTGMVFGSPPYMSPEQCLGQTPDARSDIYSLGCVMYETLTGQTAVGGKNSLEILHKQISDVPPRFASISADLNIPKSIESVVFKALAKDTEHRYQTMAELKADLLHALKHHNFDAISAVPQLLLSDRHLYFLAGAIMLCTIGAYGFYALHQNKPMNTVRSAAVGAVAVVSMVQANAPVAAKIQGTRQIIVENITDREVNNIQFLLNKKDYRQALEKAQALYDRIKSTPRDQPLPQGRLYEMLGLIHNAFDGLKDHVAEKRWFNEESAAARKAGLTVLVEALRPFTDESDAEARATK